jgi:hypothetical protein
MVRVVVCREYPRVNYCLFVFLFSAPCVSPCGRRRRFFSGEYPAAVVQLSGNSTDQIYGDRDMLCHFFLDCSKKGLLDHFTEYMLFCES